MSKHKILYVEDELVELLEISKELEDEGYEVITATSGEKALKILEKEAFDLVIADLVIGEIDGFEVVKKAKELCLDTTTMILTGYGETDFAIKALRLGVDDYMIKPYETKNFLFRVKRCLEKGELLRKNGQAAKALKESEQQKSAILDSMSEVVIYQDNEMRVKWANKVAGESVNQSPEELVGRYCYEIWHQSKTPCADCPIIQIHKTGQIHDSEMKTPDGRDWYIRGHSIKDENDNVIGIVAVAQEITERKRAEEALRVSEERFTLVAQGSSDGIWDWDIQNNSLYWSPRLKESLGYADDELDVDFDTFDSLLHPDDRAHVKAAIEVHLKDRVLYDVEERLRTKSGDYRWFHIRGHTIWDEAGNPIRMAGSNIDITERKKAEEQIKASLREKEVLLQEIHHRVRNNMQVVSSLLKLQAGTMKDEKVRQAFKEIQRRVSAMALVHQTLYKSKSMTEIELQKHIPALVDSVYRTFRVKGKVNLQVDVEDIKLSIDQATPLSLVINELISNSLQHAFPEGKGEISVKLHLRGDDEIEVVIRDNGRGMPEDIDYEKTLGLQLVKGLVESQLEGTWDIKTEAGTKHTIRFKKKE